MSQHPAEQSAEQPEERPKEQVRTLIMPVRPGVIPPSVLRADGPPPEVLRQWSDALAAAGLYTEALEVHPALGRVDVVRQAELAVLAGIHTRALELLKELTEAKSERTRRTVEPLAKNKKKPPASPWLGLLSRVADLLAGTGDLEAVQAAASKVQPSAGLDWIVALLRFRSGIC